jgi:MFS family permease
MSAVSTLADFLGLRRNVVLLLAAVILTGAGEEMWMRFLPKHLEALGASAAIIGLFDALKTLLGAIYAWPGGVLVDRWGHRRAFVAFTVLSMAGYAVLAAVPHSAAVIGGAFLYLAWSNLSLPGTFSLVGSSLPPAKHAMGIGVQSLVKRVPIVVGPVAGGILLDRLGVVSGVRAGAAISIGLGALAAALQCRIVEDRSPAAEGARFTLSVKEFSPPLKRLLVSDILVRFCERIPYAWVVIYAMDHVGASAAQVGVLIAVEMLVAMATFIPVARLADKYGKEPFVIATFVFFTLFPLALAAADSYPMLLVAFAVRGLKEFGEPARKALIIEYAPAASRGRTIGTYYLLRDTIVTAGSFLGAALWTVGAGTNFGAAALLGVAGTVFYAASLRRRRSQPAARAE